MSGMRVGEMLAYGEQRAQALLQNSVRPRLHQLAGNNRPARPLDRRRVQSISTLKAWAPKVYSGPITLIFDSVPRAGVYLSPRLGWEQFIPAGAGLCLLPDAEFNFWSDANTRWIAEVVKRSMQR